MLLFLVLFTHAYVIYCSRVFRHSLIKKLNVIRLLYTRLVKRIAVAASIFKKWFT